MLSNGYYYHCLEPTAEHKKSQESVQEGKEQFTALLASAKLRSIGIKLYNRGHALVRG